MLKEIQAFINQPYPDRDDLKSILISGLSTGALIFFILYVFQPFDVGEAPNILWTTLMFGAITAGVSIMFDLIAIRLIGINREHPNWTFIKWISYIVVLMVFIAIANYVYMTIWLLDQPFYWLGMWYMLRGVLLIGIFPITIFGALKMVRLLKQNKNIASGLSPPVESIAEKSVVQLPIQKSSSTWSVDPNDILYVEAQQNYVTIIYKSDESVTKEMIRNTLGNIDQALSKTTVIRCHRSYLVNKNRIVDISGNAQGLKLHLADLSDRTVPVSRKYIPIFRDK